MHYVYIIKSVSLSDKFYVGYTLDLQSRIEAHNRGGSVYTKSYKPWKIVFYCCFQDKSKALAFEKYLKSHSGRAFTEKRLV